MCADRADPRGATTPGPANPLPDLVEALAITLRMLEAAYRSLSLDPLGDKRVGRAKKTLASGRAWLAAEASAPALRDALAGMVEAIDHPLIREVFGLIEDSGTPEAAKLWGLLSAWFDVRDEADKAARLALASVEGGVDVRA